MSLPNEVVVSTSKLTAIGDAIRSRFGVSGDLTLDEMTSEILSGLPSVYQQVEYIQSSGSQYIDTGVTSADSYELNFLFANITNDSSPFGSRSSNKSHRFGLLYYDGMYVWQNGNANTEIQNFAVDTVYTVQAGAKFDGKIIVNETELANNISTTAGYKIYLFAFGENGNKWYNCSFSGRVYMCRIYSNSECVRDFIPCYRKSDNVIGMYDIINGQFYTNQGSGSFTCYPAPPSN